MKKQMALLLVGALVCLCACATAPTNTSTPSDSAPSTVASTSTTLTTVSPSTVDTENVSPPTTSPSEVPIYGHPTGYLGAIKGVYVFVDGELYTHGERPTISASEEMLKTFTQKGAVQVMDNDHLPTTAFAAANLFVGTPLYVDANGALYYYNNGGAPLLIPLSSTSRL